MRNKRPSPEAWARIRQHIWERDGGLCRGPYCVGAPPIPLEEAHIDHKRPLAAGGGNNLENLRVLCRKCHCLRSDNYHRGMIASALRDRVIPADWRGLVWQDADPSEEENIDESRHL